jgi:hypothetical protein
MGKKARVFALWLAFSLYDHDFRIDNHYLLLSKHSLPSLKIEVLAHLFQLDTLSINPSLFA